MGVVSWSECDQDNHKNNEQNDVHDTSRQFQPRNEPEAVHVHEADTDENSPHDKGEMPSLWSVARNVLGDQGLQQGGFTRGTSSKSRHPSKPSYPTCMLVNADLDTDVRCFAYLASK